MAVSLLLGPTVLRRLRSIRSKRLTRTVTISLYKDLGGVVVVELVGEGRDQDVWLAVDVAPAELLVIDGDGGERARDFPPTLHAERKPRPFLWLRCITRRS